MPNARAKYEITAEDKTKGTIAKIKQQFKDLDAGALALKGSLAAVAGATAMGYLVRSTVDSIDQVGKLSDRLGASTEALSQYKHVANLSGVSFNTLTMGLQRMTRRVSEAAQGTGEARGALAELNLSATDLAKLKPEQQFEVIADAINKVGSQSDKVRLAMKLFDSGGVSLLQTMTRGAAGIREMRSEADALGLTMSGQMAKDAAEANDALTRLQAAGTGLALTITRELGPSLADIANYFAKELPLSILESRKWLIALEGGAKRGFAAFLEFVGAGSGETARRYRQEYEELAEQFAQLDKKIFETTAKFNTDKNGGVFASSGGNTSGGAGGRVGSSEDETKRLKDQLKLQFDSLQESLLSEEEALALSYANRQEIVNESFNLGLINDQTQKTVLEQLEAEHQNKITELSKKGWTERQKFAALSAKDQTKTIVGELINMSAGVARENRKMFELNKAAGIANALINTYEGVSKAWSYGPFLGPPLAALVLAAGMAQVNAIKSQSFGGGGGAPSGATGGAGATTSDTIPPIETPLSQNTGQSQNTQFIVKVEGNVYYNDDFRRAMVETLQEAVNNDEINVQFQGG